MCASEQVYMQQSPFTFVHEKHMLSQIIKIKVTLKHDSRGRCALGRLPKWGWSCTPTREGMYTTKQNEAFDENGNFWSNVGRIFNQIVLYNFFFKFYFMRLKNNSFNF